MSRRCKHGDKKGAFPPKSKPRRWEFGQVSVMNEGRQINSGGMPMWNWKHVQAQAMLSGRNRARPGSRGK